MRAWCADDPIRQSGWWGRRGGRVSCGGDSDANAGGGTAAGTVLAIIRTAIAGWSPYALSWNSMVASAPSKIACATSLASARVGRVLLTMDCSISVATITGRR